MSRHSLRVFPVAKNRARPAISARLTLAHGIGYTNTQTRRQYTQYDRCNQYTNGAKHYDRCTQYTNGGTQYTHSMQSLQTMHSNTNDDAFDSQATAHLFALPLDRGTYVLPKNVPDVKESRTCTSECHSHSARFMMFMHSMFAQAVVHLKLCMWVTMIAVDVNACT